MRLEDNIQDFYWLSDGEEINTTKQEMISTRFSVERMLRRHENDELNLSAGEIRKIAQACALCEWMSFWDDYEPGAFAFVGFVDPGNVNMYVFSETGKLLNIQLMLDASGEYEESWSLSDEYGHESDHDLSDFIRRHDSKIVIMESGGAVTTTEYTYSDLSKPATIKQLTDNPNPILSVDNPSYEVGRKQKKAITRIGRKIDGNPTADDKKNDATKSNKFSEKLKSLKTKGKPTTTPTPGKAQKPGTTGKPIKGKK